MPETLITIAVVSVVLAAVAFLRNEAYWDGFDEGAGIAAKIIISGFKEGDLSVVDGELVAKGKFRLVDSKGDVVDGLQVQSRNMRH